jgi:hypothetical protein
MIVERKPSREIMIMKKLILFRNMVDLLSLSGILYVPIFEILFQR